MKTDRPWSLDLRPVYNHPEEFVYGPLIFSFGTSTIKHLRVAVKSGGREVLVFHAVQPKGLSPDPEEDYVYTYRRMVDPYDNPLNLDLNPFNQLIADAELGRKVREAGLELRG